MKINGSEIKPGDLIEHQGELWLAAKTNAVKPGKGPAYNQVELKGLKDGRKLNERFRSSETVEKVTLDIRDFSFLYSEGDALIFMDVETFEQLSVPAGLVGDAAAYLTEGRVVAIEMHEEAPIHLRMPEQAIVAVAETTPAQKGQTASASYKPAIADNGVRVMVPSYISPGDRIVVDTSSGGFIRRAD